jgi:SAM-dependent methyltransferase
MLWPPLVSLEGNENWWDKFWEDDKFPGFGLASPSLLKHLPILEVSDSFIAVDIASGDGRYAIELAKRGFKVIALELTRSGVNRIRESAKILNFDIDIIQGDILNTNCPVDGCDVTLCSGLFEEIPSSVYSAVVDNFVCWTKPGGILITRYCLFIEGRGLLIEDGLIPNIIASGPWDILYSKELNKPKISKAGFLLRHGTVIARRK